MNGGIRMRLWKTAMPGIALLLAGSMIAAPVSAAGGQPWSSTTTIELPGIQCDVDSTPQVCDPAHVHRVQVPQGKKIHVTKLRYTAAGTHCSSGRLLIALNGRVIGRTDWVDAGEQSDVELLDVTLRRRANGTKHKFSYKMQGKEGGCNLGFVGSWAGDVKLSGRKKPA